MFKYLDAYAHVYAYINVCYDIYVYNNRHKSYLSELNTDNTHSGGKNCAFDTVIKEREVNY
jgi:hypothetical protein